MYSVTATNFKMIRRCPFTKMWAISNISSVTYNDPFNSRKLTTVDRFYGKAEKGKDRYLSTTSKTSSALSNILQQTKSLFTTIQVKDSGEAPPPIFWYSMLSMVPIVAPTFSFLIFGFSPTLATAQLTFSATMCALLGGMKCGFAVCESSGHSPTWENIGLGIVPQSIAWLGLLLPSTLGFIMVSVGLAASTFIDLTTVNYPQWFKALRLALIIPVLLCLWLSAFLRLIH